ncbi:MAG: DUF2231 domain-containing protein [Gemmatimonadales bacterium]
MPDIGTLHPQVVHFVVALLFLGVPMRLLALTGKVKLAGPMATVLLLGGTLAAVIAVQSGLDAHGPVERIPGARDVVHHHEELGERTRNLFLLVVALELAALGIRRKKHYRTGVLVASGMVGLAGLFVLYETAEHGGEIVYSYAGGVGIRFGEAEDVGRLLLAGLYHTSMQDREAGRSDAAAELVELMSRRHPNDPGVTLLAVQSLLRDRQDPARALEMLRGLSLPEENARLSLQYGMLLADAYEAAGHPDSARMTLETLRSEFPDSDQLDERLRALGAGP